MTSALRRSLQYALCTLFGFLAFRWVDSVYTKAHTQKDLSTHCSTVKCDGTNTQQKKHKPTSSLPSYPLRDSFKISHSYHGAQHYEKATVASFIARLIRRGTILLAAANAQSNVVGIATTQGQTGRSSTSRGRTQGVYCGGSLVCEHVVDCFHSLF